MATPICGETQGLLEYVTVMACVTVGGTPVGGVIYQPFAPEPRVAWALADVGHDYGHRSSANATAYTGPWVGRCRLWIGFRGRMWGIGCRSDCFLRLVFITRSPLLPSPPLCFPNSGLREWQPARGGFAVAQGRRGGGGGPDRGSHGGSGRVRLQVALGPRRTRRRLRPPHQGMLSPVLFASSLLASSRLAFDLSALFEMTCGLLTPPPVPLLSCYLNTRLRPDQEVGPVCRRCAGAGNRWQVYGLEGERV